MELVYGKGLVGLKKANGQVDPKKLGWDNHGYGVEYVEINGTQYSSIDAETFLLGYVQGVQYQGLSVGGVSASTVGG